MYPLFPAEDLLRTVLVLARPYQTPGGAASLPELGRAYRRMLARKYHGLRPREHAPWGSFFSTHPGHLRALARAFNKDSRGDDLGWTTVDAVHTDVTAARVRRVQDAMALAFDADPEFADLFALTITDIFFGSGRPNAASTSSAPGAIFLDFPDTWSQGDLVDTLVHEFSHTAMFLDEARFRHYRDPARLRDRSTWVLSAVRSRRRPLDKVVHTIVVATNVLLARERFAGHPDHALAHVTSEPLAASTRRSIASVRARSDLHTLVTDRVLQILDACEEALHELRGIEPRVAPATSSTAC